MVCRDFRGDGRPDRSGNLHSEPGFRFLTRRQDPLRLWPPRTPWPEATGVLCLGIVSQLLKKHKLLSFFFQHLFVYLAALGLSCSTWDPDFGIRTLSCGVWDLVPQPGIEPGPLHREHRVLTIGKSHTCFTPIQLLTKQRQNWEVPHVFHAHSALD